MVVMESSESFISTYWKNLKLKVDHEVKVSNLVFKKRLEQPLTKQCPLVDIQTPGLKSKSHTRSGVRSWESRCIKTSYYYWM